MLALKLMQAIRIWLEKMGSDVAPELELGKGRVPAKMGSDVAPELELDKGKVPAIENAIGIRIECSKRCKSIRCQRAIGQRGEIPKGFGAGIDAAIGIAIPDE